MNRKNGKISEILKKFMKQKNNVIPFVGLVLIVIFFQIVSGGRLITMRNMKAILNDSFMTILGAVGFCFVIAQSELDFSIGANLGISCCAAAFASYLSPYLALPAAVVTGIMVGVLNAILIVKFHIESLIGTIAIQFVINGFMSWIIYNGSLGVPTSMLFWDSTGKKVCILIVLCVIGFIVFEYMEFGKKLRAIGTNREVARQSGVNVERMKMMGIIITGAMAGFLGFMSLIRTGTASTTTGSGFEIDVLSAVLLGGMPITGGMGCKFRCAILGGIMMTVMKNGMTMWGLSGDMQQLVKGIIFLVAIYLSLERKNMAVIK